jgi:hypothetical protein
LRIDSGNIHKLVRIKDPEPPIVKFDNPFVAKATQDPIDVDSGHTGRVSDVLLGQREVHFLGAIGRPHHPVPNKELKQQARNAFAG